MLVVPSLKIRHHENRGQTASDDAELDADGDSLHEPVDLLQRRGQRAGLVRPVRSQYVSGTLPSTTDEHRHYFREDADDVEDDQHHDEAEYAALRKEEALFVALHLEGEFVEQWRVARDEGGVEHAGQTPSQKQAEEGAHDRHQGADCDIVGLHVGEFVRDDRLELVIRESNPEEPFGACDEGLTWRASGRECVGQRDGRNVDRWFVLQTCLQEKIVHNANQSHVAWIVGVWFLASHQAAHERSAHVPAEDGHGDPQQQEYDTEAPLETEQQEGADSQSGHHRNAQQCLEPRPEQPAPDTTCVIAAGEVFLGHDSLQFELSRVATRSCFFTARTQLLCLLMRQSENFQREEQEQLRSFDLSLGRKEE